jgi:hypothetical protein
MFSQVALLTWTLYISAVQHSYVLGHNSLMPMEVRAPPHYYYYYYHHHHHVPCFKEIYENI